MREDVPKWYVGPLADSTYQSSNLTVAQMYQCNTLLTGLGQGGRSGIVREVPVLVDVCVL